MCNFVVVPGMFDWVIFPVNRMRPSGLGMRLIGTQFTWVLCAQTIHNFVHIVTAQLSWHLWNSGLIWYLFVSHQGNNRNYKIWNVSSWSAYRTGPWMSGSCGSRLNQPFMCWQIVQGDNGCFDIYCVMGYMYKAYKFAENIIYVDVIMDIYWVSYFSGTDRARTFVYWWMLSAYIWPSTIRFNHIDGA